MKRRHSLGGVEASMHAPGFARKKTKLMHLGTRNSAAGDLTDAQINRSVGIHKFSFPAKNKPPRGMLKHGPVVVNEDYAFGMTSAGGQQVVQTIAEYGTYPQMIAQPGPAGADQTCIKPFDIIPHVTSSNTTYWPATAEASTNEMYIKYVQSCVQLINATTFGQEVDVYVLQAKRDIPRTTANTAAFSEHYAENVWADLLVMQGYGHVGMGFAYPTVTVGTESITMVGATPTDAPEFRKYYAIKKRIRLFLAAGAQQCLDFHFGMNKLLNATRIQEKLGVVNAQVPAINNNQCRFQLMAGAYALMVVMKGAGVKDNTAVNFTHGVSELGIIVQRKWHYGLIKTQNSLFKTAQAGHNLPIPANNAAQNQILQNDTSGNTVSQ